MTYEIGIKPAKLTLEFLHFRAALKEPVKPCALAPVPGAEVATFSGMEKGWRLPDFALCESQRSCGHKVAPTAQAVGLK